jgi:hypothetical protein
MNKLINITKTFQVLKTWKVYIQIVLLSCCIQPVCAQTELEPLLNRLSPAQKTKILEYMVTQQPDLDSAILYVYELLPPEARARTIQLAQASQPNASARSLRTNIVWNRDTLKLGTLEAGAIVIDSFVLLNTGSKPYEITSHQSNCDCAVLRVPKYPILPRENATIRLEMDTRNKMGPFLAAIVLQDNSIPNARTILYVTGTVKSSSNGPTPPWEHEP